MSQPPDFGNELSHPGKAANNVNGKAKANEKPNIPIIGAKLTPVVAAVNKTEPTIGPVQEKDTIAKAKAIKNMPNKPPLSALASTLLAQELGNIISKAPKNEAANTTNNKKNAKLNHTFVERALSASAPKIEVTASPKIT